MHSINAHNVQSVNVSVRETLNSDGEPYQVMTVVVSSQRYGDLELTLFGIPEEKININFGV